MSKTKKNTNKALNQNENNNRSILSSQPITLNHINSSHLSNGNHYNNSSMSHNGSINGHDTISKQGSAKKNKKIDKSQISGPTGFRLVQHVGLSNNNNFEVRVYLAKIAITRRFEEILQSQSLKIRKHKYRKDLRRIPGMVLIFFSFDLNPWYCSHEFYFF